MSQSHSLYCSLLRALSLNVERSTNNSVQDERQQGEFSNINCVSRGFVFTEIESILQLETWDCGVACLLMIKRWLREEHSGDDDNLNDDETLDLSNRSHVLSNIRTESIWTSDLMWQLHLWNRRRRIMTTFNFCCCYRDNLLIQIHTRSQIVVIISIEGTNQDEDGKRKREGKEVIHSFYKKNKYILSCRT